MSSETQALWGELADALKAPSRDALLGLASAAELRADVLLSEGLSPEIIERGASFCARLAKAPKALKLPPPSGLIAHLRAGDWPDSSLLETLAPIEDLSRAAIALLALHLMDLADAAAIKVFVAELPAMYLRGERSGIAARQAGLAQYLRG